ncbi:serine hydrolase domain-containing protein [Thalassotalea nanhaiensis]|uniref:Serine hydrolase domain-containing protein n=1 Tax=Thalassotalea nanhaiensis TaxID=3065648 RepID=A0ABY9TKZ7_9GAMM|nr:serine hydrolase domain-containing protein [Colwelliaceae bacterium SQ345]
MTIKNTAKVLFTLSMLLLTSCGGSSSSKNIDTDPDGTILPTSIEEILENAVDKGVDGIFVYIDQTDKLNQSYVAGLQDKVNMLPANENSLFKIASISKLFIAVSTTKLIAEGQLSLNDTLAYWLPEIAGRIANSNTITIAHMLQHRSGIADFDSQSGFDWQNAHTDIDKTLLYAFDKPADFTPDSKYEYSNTNYLLLGKILDRLLGYHHQEYVREQILVPLEMYDTYAELTDVDQSLLVKGYWGNIDRSEQDYAIPGGSMISTVKDIATFIRALNTGTLLTPAEKDIYSSVYWFGHSGWLPGYQSIARYDNKIDAVVIQFINTTGDNSEDIASTSYEQILNLLRQ